MPDLEHRRIRCLELLADWERKQPGTAPRLSELLGEDLIEAEIPMWRNALRSLEDDDLVMVARAFGPNGTSSCITDAGLEEFERIRARRTDPALRKWASTYGLLHWLHKRDPAGIGWTELSDSFETIALEGERLPDDLLRRAAQSLIADGMVKGTADGAEFIGPSLLQITETGVRCVESGMDVKDYLRDQERGRGGPTFHIASYTGNMAVDSHNFSQTATTNSGVGADQFQILLGALIEALPVLGISDEREEEVRRDVDALEAEATRANPDRRFLRDRMIQTLDTVIGAGNAALGMVLRAYAIKVFGDMGVPIEPPAE